MDKRLMPKEDTPPALRLRQKMLRYRSAKRIQATIVLLASTLILIVLWLGVFHLHMVWRMISALIEQGYAWLVLLGFVGVGGLVECYFRYSERLKASEVALEQARLDYEEHVALLEGGSLSFALLEHGKLTRTPEQGQLMEDDHG